MSATSFIMSEQMFNIAFVQEVERHPCLYNSKLQEYTRKDVTEKAWDKVGEKFNITGSQCREKWKNLRTVFCRHLRRSRASSGTKRKPYYLSEAMKFAMPFIKSQAIPSMYRYDNLSNSPAESIENVTVDQGDDGILDPIEGIKLENDVPSVTCSPTHTPSSPSYITPLPSPKINILQPLSPRSYTLHIPPSMVETKRRLDSNDMYDGDMFHEDRRPKEARKEYSEMDQMKMSKKRFLLSLLPDVYAMNNEQMRAFRIKVLNLIEEVIKPPEQEN
ncbi:uncharacterized protein [Epargyreus clarus]|uniref:uncharacterized protein n=1 Tax=Epargyreus clarus TaxID=520877 RepID=UPI003C2F8A40